MKIFGIGLSRTGTMSLAKMLEQLGYTVNHCPEYKQKGSGTVLVDQDWDKKYDALLDISIIPHYQFFLIQYPEAKFILTTRNIVDWKHSCERHFESIEINGVHKLLLQQVYNIGHFSSTEFLKAYYFHHKEVMEHFTLTNNLHRLLILDLRMPDKEWILKSFLNTVKTPYPHEHKS